MIYKHSLEKVLNLLALKKFTTMIKNDQNNSLAFQATEQLQKRWNGANVMQLLHWFEAGCQRHELHDHVLIRTWSIYCGKKIFFLNDLWLGTSEILDWI